MTHHKGHLIIPIETKVREFHAKTLLACVAAEAGFDVILGPQRTITRHLHLLPRGIYLDKSVAGTKVNHFTRLHDLGFRVVAWCEEGLTYRDRAAYLNERISTKSLSLVDLFFSWGDQQADAILDKAPEAQNKIVRAGNPRLDILRRELRGIFSDDAKKLRERYGNFILINTNFSRFNHFNGKNFVIDILKKRGVIENNDDEIFFRDWISHLGTLYEYFLDMVPKVAEAFPEQRIVLRPHPSENHDAWQRGLAGLSNVDVRHEGSVIPWLMASGAVIHNSCTTGVEAYLLGRPVISYRPVTHDTFDSPLPNALSHDAPDIDTLTSLLGSLLTTDAPTERTADPARERIASEYIAGLRDALSAERIVAALLERGLNDPAGGTSFFTRLPRVAQGAARARISALRDGLLGQRGKAGYARQKLPGIELHEVENLIQSIQRLRSQCRGIAARPAANIPSCFLVSRET